MGCILSHIDELIEEHGSKEALLEHLRNEDKKFNGAGNKKIDTRGENAPDPAATNLFRYRFDNQQRNRL